ncbi:UDENN domain-containing protein [Entamoeba marina]
MNTKAWFDSVFVLGFDKDVGSKIIAQFPLIPYDDYHLFLLKFLSFPDKIENKEELTQSFTIYSYCLPNKSHPLYCHVLFIQLPLQNTRNSHQRSLVLITQHKQIQPFHNLLSHLQPSFSTSHFDAQTYAEVLFAQSKLFPPFENNKPLQIKVFGASTTITISHILPFPSFLRHHLSMLRSIWLCLLLGESIVIVSDSVNDISLTIHFLNTLISPLTYSGEVRPFYTINDTLHKSDKSFLIATTNPFIKSTLPPKTNIITQTSIKLNYNIVDTSFDCVSNMSDIEAGLFVQKSFQKNTLQFLSVFNTYFTTKLNTPSTLLNVTIPFIFDPIDCINYIQQLYFSHAKYSTYKQFISTPSFARYLNSCLLHIQQTQMNQIISLLLSFNPQQFTSTELQSILVIMTTIRKEFQNENLHSLIESVILKINSAL